MESSPGVVVMEGSCQERYCCPSKRSHKGWAGGGEKARQTSAHAEAVNSQGKHGSAQFCGEQI